MLLVYGIFLIYCYGCDCDGRFYIGVWIVLLLGVVFIVFGLLFIDVEKIISCFLESDVGSGLFIFIGCIKIW